MPGTPANAALWADADVYIATDLAATNPATAATAFNGSWSLVGLLDGGEGFIESRDQDVKDFFGWGGILLRTSRSNFKMTKKFSILEDNVTTRSLVYPGSSASTIVVPKPPFVKIAFELRDGGKVRRVISTYRAQIDVDGDIREGEDDLTKIGLMATIFPDSTGKLFDVQAAPTLTSIAITPLTLALTTGQIKKLTATATYSDATTADVSAQVAWVSSVPARATVDAGGYVTWVSAGATNVSCSLGGVTSTAPSVVTAS